MSEQQPLAKWVAEPLIDEARQKRHLDVILAAHGRAMGRAERRPRRALAVGGGLALATAAVAAVVLWGRGEPDRPILTGVTITSDQDPVAVTLADGSHLALARGAQIRIDRDAGSTGAASLVSLVRGQAIFAVPRREPRRFVVRAGTVDVVVLGTRFTVSRYGDDDLRVAVHQGVVEVRSPDIVQRLETGQVWSQSQAHEVPELDVLEPNTAAEMAQDLTNTAPDSDDNANNGADSSAESAPDSDAGDSDRDQNHRAAQGAGTASESRQFRSQRRQRAVESTPAGAAPQRTIDRPAQDDTAQDNTARDDTARESLPAAAAVAEPADAPGTAPAEALVQYSPSELIARARAAIQAGRHQDAARRFEQLLNQHPSDIRAGLAAFELGCLRMDVLGDNLGAIQALRISLTRAPRGSYREDAMARLVEAYERIGDQKRCQKARQRYLNSYPGGLHSADVTNRCQ